MTELVAVVDLGSTAVRFLLAEIRPDSGYRVLVEERVPTRLGGGPLGTLPREAIDRTLRAVHSFCSRYSPNAWGPRVVAVATSAVRDAKNRERLLGPLRRREGIDVQVLSARDEARFGVYAALDSLPFRDGVVADLGGASLQPRAFLSARCGPPVASSATTQPSRESCTPSARSCGDSSWARCRRLPAGRSWWAWEAPSARWPAFTSAARTAGSASTGTGCECGSPTSR